MKAVIIGAGRVGLGCAADILERAGMEVVVLGRGEIVEGLNLHGHALVRTVDGATATTREVPLRAVDMQADHAAAVVEIASADLVCTAVGPRNLEAILPLLTEGLEAATLPVDVIAFENTEDAGTILRRGVGAAADGHGFSPAVVDRVVAHREHAGEDRPVMVTAEPTCRVVVDGGALVRDWSHLPTVRTTEDFRAWFHAKLHCYSAGHATAAYLGQLKGYRYVHAAVADPEIAALVLGAMEEGRQGLLHRYGPEVAGTPEDLQAILHRFGNAALGDTTARVGRDVSRKVSRKDRLVGAARAARRAGLEPVNLGYAVAAALHTLPTAAPASGTHRAEAVARLTGLKPGNSIVTLVQNTWAGLGSRAALLSLDLALPAWEAPIRSAA
nr:hypothetical protein [Actinomycetales bacterium]